MGKAFNPTMYTCDLLTLFYHESFHRYVQDGKNRWTNPKNTSGQAPQVFPVDYNSRVYRKLIVLSLVNVLYDANRKTESYSRAKYWLNKFNTEYASELERAKFTDIHEGTAEYFGRNVVHSVYHQYPVIQDYDGTNLASPLRTEARRCKKNITNGWNRKNRCLPTNTNSRMYYGKSRVTDLRRL